MKIDYSSGLVLSNGDLLEATFEDRSGWDGNLHWIWSKRYTGCMITKPNGDKIWNANSWYSHIEGIKPLPTDIF